MQQEDQIREQPAPGSLNETVYRSLLALSREAEPATVRRLAEDLDLSESTVRAAISELRELGLVRRPDRLQNGWEPVSPAIELSRLLAQQAEVQERERQIALNRLALATLLDEYHETLGRPAHPEVELLTESEVARLRIKELTQQCERQVDVLRAEARLGAAVLAESLRIPPGLLIRAVFGAEGKRIPAGDHDVRIRTALPPPVSLALYDRTVALVPGSDPQEWLLVRSVGLVAALGALFDQVWERAVPTAESHADGLTAQQRDVLRLMTTCSTDDVIARQIGSSVRTVRRVVADLMEALEARSRFQAGVRAVKVGWIR
jgi:DNA-binding transcriptional ArsR family regulator